MAECLQNEVPQSRVDRGLLEMDTISGSSAWQGHRSTHNGPEPEPDIDGAWPKDETSNASHIED